MKLNYTNLKYCFSAPQAKKEYNKELFNIIAPKYNVATRILSLFQDQSWKRKLISGLPDINNANCLDLACGTGDVTFMLSKKYPDCEITGLDLTENMINIAQTLNTNKNITFICADMCNTNFQDNSFDLITGSYAFRNAPDLNNALCESYRILKPNGHLAILDFAKADNKFLQLAQYYILKFWGMLIGIIFHANPTIYEYIAHSLHQHPPNTQLENLIKQNNFQILENKKMFFGMMQILHLRKN